MLRSFEAVARHLTMRGAAEELGINHSVISRHVSDLQAWLGQKLVQTSPRGVNLTREGELYAQRITTALGMMRDATAEIRPTEKVRVVRIGCVAGLAVHWLIPRISTLQRLLHGVEVTLRPIEITASSDLTIADIFIGYGNTAQLPSHAVSLVSPRMIPVASPDWVAAHPELGKIEDLADQPLIHEQTRHVWTEWFEAAGVRLNGPVQGPLLWDAGLGLDAAVSGQGVALASRTIAAPLLAEGKLCELFDTDIRLGGYYINASRPFARSSIFKKLSDWLMVELSDTHETGIVK